MTASASLNAPLPRPPLVPGLPLIGNLPALLRDPLVFLQQAYREHGPVFRFRAGHRGYVVLAGPEANRFIAGEGKQLFCSDQFWGKATEYMQCPHMLIAVDGEMHQHQRALMQPLLGPNAFRDRADDLAAPVLELMQAHRRDRNVAWGPLARQLVSNQISNALQGQKIPYRTVQQMIHYFGSVMNVYGLRKWPKAMLYTPTFLRNKRIAIRQMDATLAQARQRSAEERARHPLYLDHILPALEAHPEWYSEGEMRSHALLPFIAALDTVAATLGFILYRLLSDRALYQRIQHEVDQHFADGIPDIRILRQMEDLNGLVKEALRLHPTAFGLTRNATADFDFGGFRIHKGEDILVFTTADHTNPAYFPAPDTFDIERYRAPRNEQRQPAFAPFGKGPHNCLGAGLAEILLPLDVGLMLYYLEITPACHLDKVKTVFNPAPVLSDHFRVNLLQRRPLPTSN
ncbi:MAG: cytochrome P450 [Gammaproteobacteria bacterium]